MNNANQEYDIMVLTFNSLIVNLTLYHWETKSYARHVASGDLVNKLRVNMDKYIEVFIGTYGKQMMSKPSTITVRHLDDGKEIIDVLSSYANEFRKIAVAQKNPDLQNIAAEVLADINQTIYLFMFN